MLTPNEYATPEQIQKNLERIKKIGDRGQTPSLFAAEEAAQAAADEAEWQAKWEATQARIAAERKIHAEGLDLPLFAI